MRGPGCWRNTGAPTWASVNSRSPGDLAMTNVIESAVFHAKQRSRNHTLLDEEAKPSLRCPVRLTPNGITRGHKSGPRWGDSPCGLKP